MLSKLISKMWLSIISSNSLIFAERASTKKTQQTKSKSKSYSKHSSIRNSGAHHMFVRTNSPILTSIGMKSKTKITTLTSFISWRNSNSTLLSETNFLINLRHFVHSSAGTGDILERGRHHQKLIAEAAKHVFQIGRYIRQNKTLPAVYVLHIGQTTIIESVGNASTHLQCGLAHWI